MQQSQLNALYVLSMFVFAFIYTTVYFQLCLCNSVYVASFRGRTWHHVSSIIRRRSCFFYFPPSYPMAESVSLRHIPAGKVVASGGEMLSAMGKTYRSKLQVWRPTDFMGEIQKCICRELSEKLDYILCFIRSLTREMLFLNLCISKTNSSSYALRVHRFR